MKLYKYKYICSHILKTYIIFYLILLILFIIMIIISRNL